MGKADPVALRTGAGTLSRTATDIETASQTIIAQSRTVEGAAPGTFGPAAARFGAAWGGELLAWAFGAATLGKIGAENAGQFETATGG
ncbi:MAG: hypothetical protein QG622_2785 [Actinomycetota bacterium]|nr:hypothetical protein [Actinomycetota bacterium]